MTYSYKNYTISLIPNPKNIFISFDVIHRKNRKLMAAGYSAEPSYLILDRAKKLIDEDFVTPTLQVIRAIEDSRLGS